MVCLYHVCGIDLVQHNKLRQYKAQAQSVEQELREHKEQSSSAKNKYADWNTELQKKLREFREEKKAWFLEAATLRTAEKEARVKHHFILEGLFVESRIGTLRGSRQTAGGCRKDGI